MVAPNENAPKAVFSLPVVIVFAASLPKALLKEPVVVFCKALCPKALFPVAPTPYFLMLNGPLANAVDVSLE